MQNKSRQENHKTVDPVLEFNFAYLLFLGTTVVIFTPDAQKTKCPVLTSLSTVAELAPSIPVTGKATWVQCSSSSLAGSILKRYCCLKVYSVLKYHFVVSKALMNTGSS